MELLNDGGGRAKVQSNIVEHRKLPLECEWDGALYKGRKERSDVNPNFQKKSSGRLGRSSSGGWCWRWL